MSAIIALLLAQTATGAIIPPPAPAPSPSPSPAPAPSPTPTPTPVPGVPTLEPTIFDATPAFTAVDTETALTNPATGFSYPGQAVLSLMNSEDFEPIEAENGKVLFFEMDIGNDDGFSHGWVEFGGVSANFPTGPGLVVIDGKLRHGLAVRVRCPETGPALRGFVQGRCAVFPRRGRPRFVDFTVYLNTRRSGGVPALPRPVRWMDPVNGNDSNDGLTAGTAKRSWLGATEGYAQNSSLMASGWHINILPGTFEFGATINNGLSLFGNPVNNTGPITASPAPGVAKADVRAIMGGASADLTARFRVRRLMLLDLQIDTWQTADGGLSVGAGFVTATATPGNGSIIFGPGCDLFDAAGGPFASANCWGPNDKGRPVGVPQSQIFGQGRNPSAFNRDQNGIMAVIGTAANPVRVRTTHIGGAHKYWEMEGQVAYSLIFFQNLPLYRGKSVGNVTVTGLENFYVRMHDALDLTVETVTPRVFTIAGQARTLWEVKIAPGPGTGLFYSTGPDWTNAPSIAARTNIPSTSHGQHFAQCFDAGGNIILNPLSRAAGNWIDTIGPPSPPSINGLWAVRPDLGHSICGYDSANRIVWLFTDPGPVASLRCLRHHGNHAFFGQPGTNAGGFAISDNAENIMISHVNADAPEQYQLWQWGLPREVFGTCSLSGNTLTFLQANPNIRRGDLIHITDGSAPALGSSAIVQRVISPTQVEVRQTVNGANQPVAPFSGAAISGRTFGARACLNGLAIRNSFFWGGGASPEISSPISDFYVRGSTLAYPGLYGGDIIVYANQPHVRWHCASITDSYLSGISTAGSGNALFDRGFYSRNSQWGRQGNRDTTGGGATGQATFQITRRGDGSSIVLAASGAAPPVDLAGIERVAGTSRIGAFV